MIDMLRYPSGYNPETVRFLLAFALSAARALRGLDPLCIVYGVFAAVLLYRAWRFRNAGKHEAMHECVLHAVHAFLVAPLHVHW